MEDTAACTQHSFARRLLELNKGKDREGYCREITFFTEVLAAFPANTVTFELQNYNVPEHILAIALDVPSISDCNTIYVLGQDLTLVFPELAKLCAEMQKDHRCKEISFEQFFHESSVLPYLLGRPVYLVHRYKPDCCKEQKNAKVYGPFCPD